MKKLLSVALAWALISPALLIADTLDPETFTVSGKIYQQDPMLGKPLKVTPLTIKNLLVLFGYPDVKPAKAKFFYDENTNSDVLASADRQTIYGTLFTYTDNSPVGLAGKPGVGVKSSTATMMNGLLSGFYFLSYHDTPARVNGTVTFSGDGTLPSGNAIIKGTFTYSQVD